MMASKKLKKIKKKILLAWYSVTEKIHFTIGGKTYGFSRVDDWEKRYGVEDVD